MSAAKPIVTLALLSLLGTGGYCYWLRDKLRAARDTISDQHSAIGRAADDTATCQRDRDADRAAAAQVASTLKISQSELDALRAERAETEKRLEAFRALTASFQKMIDSGKLQVTMRHGRMIVKLPAEILFASDSADVLKAGQAALAEVAAILRKMPERRFMVAGHTDNLPVTPPSAFQKQPSALHRARGDGHRAAHRRRDESLAPVRRRLQRARAGPRELVRGGTAREPADRDRPAPEPRGGPRSRRPDRAPDAGRLGIACARGRPSASTLNTADS